MLYFAGRDVATPVVVDDDDRIKGDATAPGPTSRSSLLSWQEMTFIKAAEVLLSSQYIEGAWHRDVET